MARQSKSATILIAEDDPDDRMLLEDAFKESRVSNDIVFVEDGEKLLSYLRREGQYADPDESPTPGMILLDLNMPRMDGREALRHIKSDETFRQIPVVVFTTSRSESDIARTYGLGVSSYISKPVTFEALVDVVRTLGRYWLDVVELPPPMSAPGKGELND